jgi:hypothetical protein
MKKEQIYNLMYFTFIFSTDGTILEKCTPDYILEKYNIFVSSPSTMVYEKSKKFNKFLKSYYNKWCIYNSKNYKKNSKLYYTTWCTESVEFINVLYFLFETTYETYVWDTTPNFVLEKFKKYIGDPEIIKDGVDLCSTVHILIRRKFEESYLTDVINERQIKILTIL